MKTKTGKLILTLAVILSIGFIASCGDDDDGDKSDPADKTTLAASIAEAELLIASTEEGNQEGQYLEGSQEDLQDVIDASMVVFNNASATQTQVDNTNTNLQLAITTYEDQLITPIAPADLIAHWRFDEGTGTTVSDDSDNTFDGTLTEGHESLGGGIPTWFEDRNGTAGKALWFTEGGHVEVPSNAAFNPAELTISLWVMADHVYNDNYMVAQNSYHGYKFQLQEANKPFFTVNYGVDQYINEDTGDGIGGENHGLPIEEWHHVAMTFKSGELAFYVDGQQVRLITGAGVTHTPTTLADRFDFVIGQELPNAEVDPEISWVLPHFEGALDEVRMYKKALNAGQIQQIYALED